MYSLIESEYENILSDLRSDLLQFSEKSLLITGAGLIGSYLVKFINYANEKLALKCKIHVMDISKGFLEERFKDIKDIALLEQNLNEPIITSIDFDYVIHTASNAHPLAFAQDPVGTMKTNILGTMNLLEILRKSHGKFLYLSTGEIYGNNIDHPFTENDLGVVDTKIARSCYPESKRATETLCVSYAQQYGIPVNIVRLCYIYGPSITNSNSRADAQFLRNAIDKEDIVLKSKGSQRRTYCYVADCVSALLTVLLKGQSPEVYNVANKNSIVSVAEYAQILADVAGVGLRFEIPDEVEAKGYSKQADSILDATKLEALGWCPQFTLRDGLDHTFQIKKEM